MTPKQRLSRYSEEEINFIKENYKNLMDKEIGIALNRPTSSIKDKRLSLELKASAKGKWSGEKHWGWKGGKQEVNCLICKKTILREKWELKRNKGFLCSKECKSLWMSSRTKEKHPRYKGKWETSDGYVLVHLPEHPFSDKAGYVKEHRLIVEKFIGRYLKSEEVVHHIDENPSNNSIHNLMLFPSHSKHMSFHHKMTQFGMTNPIKGQIKDRWIPILKENQ